MPYLTIPKRTDGFGAQYQGFIWGILFAEVNGNTYVYRKIESMEHNYDNDPTFLNRIEETMNIQDNYLNYDQLTTDDQITEISRMEYYKVIEGNFDTYLESESMQKIKRHFWENKDKNIFNNGKINVAIHIRRPNPHDSRLEGADTSDQYYLKVIQMIKARYGGENDQLCFHIFSQGSPEKFSDEFKQEKCMFHLNEDVCSDFVKMVAADILVTSRSSLSYCAALLSDNTVFYLPFWHPPSRKWIVVD